MSYYPVIIIFILAILDWIAVIKGWKMVEYVAKPATMLALLGWIGLSVGWGGPMTWFTVGAIFCLAGDVLLLLPSNRIIFGLLAFLVGQICYIVGFNNIAPYIQLWSIIPIVILGIYVAWMCPKLISGLASSGKSSLKIPILVYSIMISLMVFSALMTWSRPGWSSYTALAVSLGALLFYTSDSLLAWRLFVNPQQHSRFVGIAAYHLGQIGIIFGAILHAALK